MPARMGCVAKRRGFHVTAAHEGTEEERQWGRNAKWEKAAQKVGARAIKVTGEAGKNVTT